MAAATKADNASQTLNTMIKNLLSGLEPLQKGFVGAAGASFQSVQIRINDDLNNMTQALRDVSEGIRSAGSDFSATDDQAQQDVTNAAQGAGDIMNRLRGNG
jgi:WXG100 family type VII secretion target